MKYCTTCHACYTNDVTSCPVDDSVLRTTSDLGQGMIIRGKYEILKKIGTGGMASVYLARHLAFDELRAIKVVRSWMAEDEGFLRRLRSEAVILRKLQHPNAVRVDDIDNFEDGRPFIVMEYVQGVDLHTVIRDKGPFSVPRLVAVASQIASALAAAHKLGIIHRDIKPENILVVRQSDGSELVKVLDFGIAKLRGSQGDESCMTQAGLVLCTPEYASPEQARGLSSDHLDGRSDLYSLGLLMYEMLTGQLPFHADTTLGMLLAQINTLPASPAELKPELNIPSDISDLLLKVLQKDPDQRFQSAEEMLQAMAQLRSFTGKRASASRPVSSDSSALKGSKSVTRMGDDTGSTINESQALDSHAMQDLFQNIDVPQSRVHNVWIWALSAMLVLAAAGGIVYLKWHPAPNADTIVLQPSDREILGNVEEKVHAVDGARKIRASVTKGVVSLVGEASSQSAIDETALNVSAVSGVVRVNRAEVRVVNSPLSGGATAMASQLSRANTFAQPAKTGASNPSPEVQLGQPNEGRGTAAGSPSTSGGPSVSMRNQVRELMGNANQAMDDGEYDLAITSYAAVLKIEPGNAEARGGKRKAEHAKQYEAQLDNPE